jgi:hypothetical protein
MTEPEGRAGLRHRLGKDGIQIDLADAIILPERIDWEQYCRDKSDPHAEAWGDDR